MFAWDLDLPFPMKRTLANFAEGRFLGGNWKLSPPGSALFEVSEAVDYHIFNHKRHWIIYIHTHIYYYIVKTIM